MACLFLAYIRVGGPQPGRCTCDHMTLKHTMCLPECYPGVLIGSLRSYRMSPA